VLVGQRREGEKKARLSHYKEKKIGASASIGNRRSEELTQRKKGILHRGESSISPEQG